MSADLNRAAARLVLHALLEKQRQPQPQSERWARARTIRRFKRVLRTGVLPRG